MPIQEILTFETGINFPVYLLNLVGITAQSIALRPELLIGLGITIICGVIVIKVVLWFVPTH